MKKQILTLGILTCSSILYAQPQKGRVLLGGSIDGFNNTYQSASDLSGSSNTKNTSTNISPRFEYFYSNKSSLGILLNFGLSSNSQNSNTNDSTTTATTSKTPTMGLGFYQTTYRPLYKNLYLGLKHELNSSMATISTQNTTSKYKVLDSKEHTLVGSYGFNVGLVYFVSNRLVLNTYMNLITLGVQHMKTTEKTNYYDPSTQTYSIGSPNNVITNNSISLNMVHSKSLGTISLGIYYYLGKKASNNTPTNH